MARRRSNRPPIDPVVRDILSVPTLPPPRPLPELSGLDQARAIVKAIEDRRRFHPLGRVRPPKAITRWSTKMVVRRSPSGKLGRDLYPGRGLSFSVPREVAICVRRKERREVIFAQRKTGKGSRSRRRRNRFSDIGC